MLKDKTKKNLKALRKHNLEEATGGIGGMNRNIICDTYEDSLEDFSQQVQQTRMGSMKDRHGRAIAANDISLAAALTYQYGIMPKIKDAYGRPFSQREMEYGVIKDWLKAMDVYVGSDTLHSMGKRFGNDNLTHKGITSLLEEHSQFDGLNVTSDINPDFRWIIPEIILAAIRLDYEGLAFHTNWITGVQNVSQRKITMPHIERGNAAPRKLGEAESIPFGTVRFGQKEATVQKIGIGFKITDELVESSTIDMLFTFLSEIGTDMTIGTDMEARTVLINGEQANNSESAAVVGTTDGTTFAWKDIKRGTSRMRRLNRIVNRLITGEEDGIDISEIDKFQGFDGQTRLAEFRSIIGVPPVVDNDVFPMPADQIMFLASASAMMKLRYKSMKVEERRNPQNQETELFVSDYVGFAIVRRDGRFLMDKTVAYDPVAGQAGGFPTYMDIDARIAETFKDLQGN